MHSVLSPLAQPFSPASGESLEFAIFNNGVPSLVCVGEHPEHDVLQGIPDEAIDEKFPPTAEEAAELEAVEIFVEAMAILSILEDREEKARLNFSHLKKRWEARREDGLVGRPRPPRSNADRTRHGSVVNVNETNLVPYDHYPRAYAFSDLESRIRAREGQKRIAASSKQSKGSHGYKMPIQQPRKHY